MRKIWSNLLRLMALIGMHGRIPAPCNCIVFYLSVVNCPISTVNWCHGTRVQRLHPESVLIYLMPSNPWSWPNRKARISERTSNNNDVTRCGNSQSIWWIHNNCFRLPESCIIIIGWGIGRRTLTLARCDWYFLVNASSRHVRPRPVYFLSIVLSFPVHASMCVVVRSAVRAHTHTEQCNYKLNLINFHAQVNLSRLQLMGWCASYLHE